MKLTKIKDIIKIVQSYEIYIIVWHFTCCAQDVNEKGDSVNENWGTSIMFWSKKIEWSFDVSFNSLVGGTYKQKIR